jgi:hypothetical protein
MRQGVRTDIGRIEWNDIKQQHCKIINTLLL